MEKFTETEIAGGFFGNIMKDVDEAWPQIYRQLKRLFGKEYNFEIENEEKAKMDLSFAVIALELESLKNIFPDRAERIYNKAINSIDSFEERSYMKRKIDLYKTRFYEATGQYARNKLYSPLEEVAVQLLREWFREKINNFYVRNTQVVNPAIAGVLNPILVSLCGFWKTVKNNFEIVDD